MPINTNLTEDLEVNQENHSSTNPKIGDAVENHINHDTEEVADRRTVDEISVEPVATSNTTSRTQVTTTTTRAKVKTGDSERSLKVDRGTKSGVVASAGAGMALQQQVSEKLKALSDRLKITRNRHFNTEPTNKQRQSGVTTTSITAQCGQISTNLKSTVNLSQGGASSSINVTKSDLIVKGRSSASAQTLTTKQATKSNRRESESQKTRLEQLEAEVSALHKLLGQLSLENPELRPRIATLARNIPELKQMDIVKLIARLEGGLDHHDEQRPTTSYGRCDSSVSLKALKRPHLETEGQLNVDGGGPTKDNESLKSRPRKRNMRSERKRKNSTKQKCQVSELRDLSKYINNIVEEFLLKNDKVNASTRSNLRKFSGNFDDLEMYAAHLVEVGLGRIVEDELRVNRKNNRQSFVTMSTDREALERDGMVMLPVARRYAFEGDIVRAFVLNSTQNSDNGNGNEKNSDKSKSISKDTDDTCTDDDVLYDASDSPDSDLDSNELLDATGPTMAVNCPKAFVIEILKHTDDRKAVGSISFKTTTQLSGGSRNLFYKFRPLDTRLPLMYVPEDFGELHARSAKALNEVTDLLYLAQICETDINGHCIAELLEKVGKVGHLEHELKAILLHNGLKDIKPYEQRFEDLFNDSNLPELTDKIMKDREDLRKKCIFTIDPLTARDLDDALSIDKISDDEYEVGVHIADVAYFLEEGSELDDIVKSRATSIYLVNEVIHMLPIKFCYKCSLLPGEDKFAFSVFWHMNRNGDILGTPRFTRSIINSCTKFAYGHAQKIIESGPNGTINPDDYPDIFNGFTLNSIAERVLTLHELAQHMRRRRYDNGALSINNPKLRFDLEPTTGEPVSFEIDRLQESNHLIEEFMLLANMSVAQHIYERYPDISLLRNHAPPLMTSLKNLQEKLLTYGINLDLSSSKSIYSSMQQICNEAEDAKAMSACLSTLLTKPMARAKYICSEGRSTAELWHYALSIPIYTHFTSPIRRYPDILVHRLLAATLNYCPQPQRTPDELRELSKICNDQKFNAKNAGDESVSLYFKRYVKAKQGITMCAAVLEIYKHLVNVVTVHTGHVLPIQYKAQKVIVDTSNAPLSIQISEKGSKQRPIKLQMFSRVDIKLVIRDEKLVAFFVSPDPKQRQINCIEMTKNNNLGPKSKINNNGGGGKQNNITTQQSQPKLDHPLNVSNQQQQQQQQQQQTNDNELQKQLSESQLQQKRTVASQIFQSLQRAKKTKDQKQQQQ